MKLQQIYLALRKRLRLAVFGRYCIARRGGVTYLLDSYGYIDRNIEAYGSYEREQLNYLIKSINKNKADLFIDAGANLGLYSINVAKSIHEIKIIAFEPDVRNRAQLMANLFINNLEDAVLVESCALSDQIGSSPFKRHARENPGRSCLSDDGNHTVPTMRLDDIVHAKGKRIAVKIDVEGHELALLQGAKRVLEQNECVVQIESFKPETICNFFDGLNYRLEARFGNDYFFVNHTSLSDKNEE